MFSGMVNRYSSSIGTSYCQLHEYHLYLGKKGLNTYAPEGLAVPVSFVTPVVLLQNDKNIVSC